MRDRGFIAKSGAVLLSSSVPVAMCPVASFAAYDADIQGFAEATQIIAFLDLSNQQSMCNAETADSFAVTAWGDQDGAPDVNAGDGAYCGGGLHAMDVRPIAIWSSRSCASVIYWLGESIDYLDQEARGYMGCGSS